MSKHYKWVPATITTLESRIAEVVKTERREQWENFSILPNVNLFIDISSFWLKNFNDNLKYYNTLTNRTGFKVFRTLSETA